MRRIGLGWMVVSFLVLAVGTGSAQEGDTAPGGEVPEKVQKIMDKMVEEGTIRNSEEKKLDEPSQCGECAAELCPANDAVQRRIKFNSKRLRRKGFPQRIADIQKQRDPACFTCVRNLPLEPELLVVGKNGEVTSTVWKDRDEWVARKNLKRGKIKAFYVTHGRKACSCCGDQTPYQERDDYIPELELNKSVVLAFETVKDLKADPDFMGKPRKKAEHRKKNEKPDDVVVANAKKSECADKARDLTNIRKDFHSVQLNRFRIREESRKSRSELREIKNQRLAILKDKKIKTVEALDKALAPLDEEIKKREGRGKRRQRRKVLTQSMRARQVKNALEEAELQLQVCEGVAPSATPKAESE